MKAAIYSRVSTDMQAEEGFSIAAQIKLLNEYCQRNNIIVYASYSDEGISGQKEDRPQFQKMIKDAEKKLFDIILVHKFDRFARRVELSQRIKRQLKNSGINVVSITEPVEDSPIGFFQEGIMELLGEYFVRDLAARSKMGHIERASQGLHNGSVPYGYKVDHFSPAKMSINDEQAKTVRLIFDLYLNKGYGCTKIARVLNDANIPSAVDGQWAYFTVNRVIKNPKYAGYIEYDGKLYEGKHAAIVSKEQHDLVKKYLKDRTWKREYRGANFVKFTMLGLLKCGYCGCVMRIQKYTRNHFGYICNGATHYDKPDRCTHNKVYNVQKLELEIENIIENYINKGYTESYSEDNTFDFMAARKAELENRWDRINAAYQKGAYDLDYFLKMDKQIKRELCEIVLTPPKKIDTKSAWERYKTAETPTDKRNILKEFIVSINITKEEAEIVWQPGSKS